jgi:short-subunit dehydrogenase
MAFAGQVAWITGASSGIGAAMARALAAQGAHLVLSGRNARALAEVAADCGDALVLPFEATDHAAMHAAADAAWDWAAARSGGIDMLVNNAGISQRSLALDTDFSVYRTIMEVDFFAPLRLTQLVLPAMVARRSGRIINNASVAGKVGSPLRTGYCAAKHALVGWSDALRAEIAQYDVQVHVLTPGFVATGIAANAITGDGSQKGAGNDPVNDGISIHEAAQQIIAGILAGSPEIPVGRDGAPEMQLLDLKRQNPEGCFLAMAGMAPKVAR